MYGLDARYRRRAPGVRDAFSKALGAKNRLLCTEWKFGAKNSLLWYAMHLQCANSFQYNAMDLVTNICSGASTSVNYSYLWNRAKTNLL